MIHMLASLIARFDLEWSAEEP